MGLFLYSQGMDYKVCLAGKPWLRPYNALELSSRLLHATKGNAFIVFNMIHSQYELHTVEAFELSGDSVNIVLSEEQLSGFLVHDFRANDMALYAEELISARQLGERDHENREALRGRQLTESLRSIERAIGTKI